MKESTFVKKYIKCKDLANIDDDDEEKYYSVKFIAFPNKESLDVSTKVINIIGSLNADTLE